VKSPGIYCSTAASAGLALIVALFEEGGMLGRIALLKPNALVPFVRDAGHKRIERRAHTGDQIR